MPRLEDLRLFAHEVDAGRLFAQNMPHLQVLHVFHLHDYPLEVLAANPSLGRLRELSLWPHALEPGDEEAYITVSGARALVHSPHLTSLSHLELHLSDLGDEGCEEIVRSGILKRLKTLVLAHGRITDEGARLLAACPDLPRLERLDLSRNALTDAGIGALLDTGVRLEADDQFRAEDVEDLEHLFEGDIE
jgi:hypothetical protein